MRINPKQAVLVKLIAGGTEARELVHRRDEILDAAALSVQDPSGREGPRT
ncbi:MAG: hypothetical protein NVS3B21_31220 [Acidimicrobiales bacterium]